MLSCTKKDKKYRALVKKFEIKALRAKVFSQDLSLNSLFCLKDGERSTLHASQENYEKKSSKGITISNLVLSMPSLSKVSRNSSKTRVRNRCIETGRSRSILRFCKLSRIVLREKASKGCIPGVSKASW